MNEPKRDLLGPQSALELDSSELTQEIDSPLDDFTVVRDEPALSEVDFDEIELALDF